MSGDTNATADHNTPTPTTNAISDVIYSEGDEIRLRETIMVDTVAPIMGTILMVTSLACFAVGFVMLVRRTRG